MILAEIKGRIQQVTSLVLWFLTFQIALSLPAQDASVGNSTSFNKSLDAQSIDIPAASPLSKRHFGWLDAVAKGNKLLCRLENPDLLNDQSTVTSTDTLATSGWVAANKAVDLEIHSVLNSFFLQEGIENNLGDIVAVRWKHNEVSRNSKGEIVPATKARYVNFYNAKAGFIIGYNNFGPAWMVGIREIKTLPDITAWSDITFVEWQTQAQANGQDIRGLKYVIRYEIVNTVTASIINEAAGSMYRIQWPGVTILMSDEKGRAILGTPNGVGVAYLLATHKTQLGQKTVESVHVWSRQVQWSTGPRSLLYAVFKIGPVASSSGPSTS